MTIGTVTLMASGADVATGAGNNIVTASFTCTAGRLYFLMLSQSASSNGVTAGHNGTTAWSYQKTQTNGAGIIVEVFGGLCTTTTTATATINWPAAATATYAIIEVQNPAATTPIVQKPSAAAATVTMAAATGVEPAIFLAARNANAMTIEAGYTSVASIGTTHKLLAGFRSTFETTPSFTGTASGASIIGLEVASVSAAGTPPRFGLQLLGIGMQ